VSIAHRDDSIVPTTRDPIPSAKLMSFLRLRLGLAMQDYESANGVLPPQMSLTFSSSGRVSWESSWSAPSRIIPYTGRRRSIRKPDSILCLAN
jgi:hypothetical protein